MARRSGTADALGFLIGAVILVAANVAYALSEPQMPDPYQTQIEFDLSDRAG
ncbi:hypothetical protein OU426_09515 [Frigidibacter sp. RF13]|uniref:hypothetical protein n=1 Tax=Frigidibacter sp. RF13 TaxID=2997340 RepID=UPI0022714EC9|nr:hypothetical protein [Frigidibacter sp. RF13]MCY1127093.1 hypothetical protein [Frigidibacter sp. RF13]